MEMRSGYKQSEIGAIPEEWDVVPFQAVFRKMSSKPHQIQTSDYLLSGSLPVVDQGQQLIVGFTERNDRIFKVPDGGVAVFGDHTCILKFVDFDFVVGADGTQILVAKGANSVRFHAYALQYRGVEATGYNRHFKFLKERTFAVPPPAEQVAIAAALSDMDVALAGMETLITKKRDLKHAAMHQLLTGKTRLPGFTGRWKVKRLGDHVTFLKNGMNSRAQLSTGGTVKYLHYGDIHVATSTHLDPRVTDMPTLPTAFARRLDRLVDGDIVFVDASEDLDGVGKAVELVGTEGLEVVAGLHTIAARFDKVVLADGFKAYVPFVPSFCEQLRRLAAGTKVYATNRAHVASVEMHLPGADEQRAIARVISDMDAEIGALEARRNKARSLKRAMMQQLLTGHTRLSPFGGAHV